jgi:hypothetical protein
MPIFNQPASHWIIKHIFDLCIEVFRRPQYSIERFLLPHSSTVLETMIDGMSRSAFYRLHDFCQRNDQLSRRIDQRSQNHMHVIGHDHRGVQLITDSIIMPAAAQNDVARPFGQNPSPFRNKSDEMRFRVALQMRQIAAVEGHTAIVEQIQSRAANIPSNFGRSIPFRESCWRRGRCPHMPSRAKLGYSWPRHVILCLETGELRSPAQTWGSGPTWLDWSNTALPFPSAPAWRAHPYPSASAPPSRSALPRAFPATCT